MAPLFDPEFRLRLTELLAWRRDVRHFRGEPLPDGALRRLIGVAMSAPSVGLSQPSRFVIVDGADGRDRIRANFESCNAEALAAQPEERANLYARLKLAGLREAPCHLAIFADPTTGQGHGLGRRTMPETIAYSTVAAVHTLWLAARAEGIGMGWVSILDPKAVATSLDIPAEWIFIGYFCLGFPRAEDDRPELERAGWENRRDVSEVIIQR